MADDFDTAFPTLTDADMAVLDKLGRRRPIAAGEYLFREGDVSYDFNAVVSGAIEIVTHDGTQEQIVAEHGPGKFIGELNLLTGMRVFVSARAVEPSEVIVVPRDSLRRLIATDPGLGDTILVALMARRSVLLTGASASLRIIGSRFCPDCQQLREFVSRSGIPYEWLDPDSDPDRGHRPGAVRHRPRRIARRHHLGIGPAAPHPRLFGRVPGPHGAEPARPLLRPGRRRRRSRRPGRLRLRRLRGTAHARPREVRRRWPGGVELTDRELPRVPHGDLGWRPDSAGHDPGREVRRLPHRPV